MLSAISEINVERFANGLIISLLIPFQCFFLQCFNSKTHQFCYFQGELKIYPTSGRVNDAIFIHRMIFISIAIGITAQRKSRFNVNISEIK